MPAASLQRAPAKTLAEKIQPVGELKSSNDVFDNSVSLRARMEDEGYLFFKGVLSVPALHRVRKDILLLCRKFGWLDEKADLMDGIYRGGPFPSNQEYNRLYNKLLELDSFNALSISMELIELLGKIVEGPVLAHRRNIARITFPGSAQNTTQPHQDFMYIRGTPKTYTAWFPTGDCPKELGGLAVLEHSHQDGFIPHVQAIGAGGHGIATKGTTKRWLASAFEAGDLLVFHSHTIHGALENSTEDRLRISMDFRYQRAGDLINESSMRLHLKGNAGAMRDVK